MTTTTVDTVLVTAALWEAGLDEDENLTNTYSGRAMGGKECFGITCENMSQATIFIAHLAAEEPDLALRLANALRTDHLGTHVIVYFPGYTLEGFDGNGGDV
jgi:hypothetical protein